MEASPVDRAIDGGGGLRPFAKAIGVSYQAVQKWRRSGIPAERVIKVEEVSGVSRFDLRPDLYGDMRLPSTVTSRKRA